MTDPVEIVDPAWRLDHVEELGNTLAWTLTDAPEPPDPSVVPDPKDVVLIDPAWWLEHRDELTAALAIAAKIRYPGRWIGGRVHRPAVGRTVIVGGGKLTYSVEEAAQALRISRAFPYEACARGEMPHIRIGRRILIPKSALPLLVEWFCEVSQ